MYTYNIIVYTLITGLSMDELSVVGAIYGGGISFVSITSGILFGALRGL